MRNDAPGFNCHLLQRALADNTSFKSLIQDLPYYGARYIIKKSSFNKINLASIDKVTFFSTSIEQIFYKSHGKDELNLCLYPNMMLRRIGPFSDNE